MEPPKSSHSPLSSPPKTSESALSEKISPIFPSLESVRFVNVDDTFEALLRACEHCQNWITLADTKAGFILTIHGVLSGFLLQYIPQIQQAFPTMSLVERTLLLGTLSTYFCLQLLSFLFTVQIFFPRKLNIDYRNTCHVFPVGLQQAFPRAEDREKFWDEYKTLKEEDLKKEYAMQYHTDGLVCNLKYDSLRKALKTLFIAGILGFFSFTFIQFFVIARTLPSVPPTSSLQTGSLMNKPLSEKSIYDFVVKDIDGKEVKLSQFKGNALLFVNVASKCGYTPQYTSLQNLYLKYKEKGLVVLGFPANNFGAQEPGSESEIKTFCSLKYNVTFPMFSKISVQGADKHPLYRFLTEKETNPQHAGDVKWNFSKFLVNKSGQIVARFDSAVKPESATMSEAIEGALK